MNKNYQIGVTFLKPHYQNIPDDVEPLHYEEAVIEDLQEYLYYFDCFIALSNQFFWNPGYFDFYSLPATYEETIQAQKIIHQLLGNEYIKTNLLEVSNNGNL